MDFGDWDHEPIQLHTLCQHVYRALRPGGTAIIWYDIWKLSGLATALLNAKMRMLRLIIWNKTNPVPLNSKVSYLTNAKEIAVCAVKGSKPTFNSQYDTGSYDCAAEWDYDGPIPRHNGRRIHPTQKPLDLFEKLIVKHSNPGDLVVDHFLGSGTTAIAARNYEREFAGCDIDPNYVELATERMNNGNR